MKIANKGWGTVLRRLALMGVLLTVAASSLSCGNSCEYTNFMIEEDDGRIWNGGHALFSFEYPQCFNEVPAIDDFGIIGVTHVYFTRKGTGEFKYRNFHRIDVTVYREDLFGLTDAETTVEDVILDISTDEYKEDFLILEHSSITIAGLTAEYVYYSFHTPTTPRDYREWDTLVKYVCFVHDGFLWQIDFEYGPVYDEESQEEVEAWFDHLIETFEILE